MKNITKVSAVVIGIALIIIGAYVYSKSQIVEIRDRTSINPDVIWSYQQSDMDAEYADPKTIVTVQLWDKKQEVGEYAGSCWDRPEEDLVRGEISGIRCWWAGGGDDIGVFRESDTFVIKHRIVEEGTAEESGFMGEFENVSSLSAQ